MAVHDPTFSSSEDSTPHEPELLDVLDLLISQFAEERQFCDSPPPPLLFGVAVDNAEASMTPSFIDLMIRPLWNGDPVDQIGEFLAPAQWRGIGLVAASTAHVDPHSFDITMGVVVDRDGAALVRLVSSDGQFERTAQITTDSGEGQLIDALRRALVDHQPPDCQRVSTR